MAAEVEVYEREDGNWDWRLTAINGLVLCGSQQGYTERNDAVEGLGRAIDAICNDVLQLGGIQPLGGSKIAFDIGIEGSDETVAFAVDRGCDRRGYGRGRRGLRGKHDRDQVDRNARHHVVNPVVLRCQEAALPMCDDHLGTAFAVGLSEQCLTPAGDALEAPLDINGVDESSFLDATVGSAEAA